MSSELNLEIQRHLIQYLNGAVSLAEFENWFAPVLWDIDDEDKPTRALAGTVHVLISEFSSGGRTLESLRENLAAAVRIPV